MSGLLAVGDEVVMVEGVPVAGQLPSEVENQITGAPGTRLTLHVKCRGKGNVCDPDRISVNSCCLRVLSALRSA